MTEFTVVIKFSNDAELRFPVKAWTYSDAVEIAEKLRANFDDVKSWVE